MIEKFKSYIKLGSSILQNCLLLVIGNLGLIGILSGQAFINVEGNWNYAISPIVEAGNDFSYEYTSNPAQVYLSATTSKGKGNGNFRWSFSIHKEDIFWDAALQLFVKRTGNGNGGGFIQGGTAFQEISNNDNFFFSGKKSRADIPLQFQIQGVSVLIPSGNYATSVVYTLREE